MVVQDDRLAPFRKLEDSDIMNSGSGPAEELVPLSDPRIYGVLLKFSISLLKMIVMVRLGIFHKFPFTLVIHGSTTIFLCKSWRLWCVDWNCIVRRFLLSML